MQHYLKDLRSDLPASIIVFFVAVPLCLGIALAAGAPLFAGILSGIIGGIVVGSLSGSSVGVSGPAAGLVVIIISGISSLNGWENFLTAVSLSGIIQIIMGYFRLGFIAYYFPNSVIKGMLCGIGIIIILKQIPHIIGYDADYFGDIDFNLKDGNTLTLIQLAIKSITPEAIAISIMSLIVLFAWETTFIQSKKFLKYLQAPLIVVLLGIVFTFLSQNNFIPFTIEKEHLVNIPEFSNIFSVIGHLSHPSLSALSNPQVYIVAFTIAIVGSIETLLCVDATDKLDPQKRITPPNRELKAQGFGNLLAGALGGLPITQVIVRSSANISFGGKTKVSAILHGVFIFLSIMLIPNIINMIPLASLSCILLLVGYKLAKPELFKKMYQYGAIQFAPFLVTVVVMQFTDLLKGVFAGLIVAIIFILKKHYINDYQLTQCKTAEEEHYKIQLAEDVSFLNKGALAEIFRKIPNDATVDIDFSNNKMIDHDVEDVIEEFQINSKCRNITVNIIGADASKITY
jgi:SulP family sulfate permease